MNSNERELMQKVEDLEESLARLEYNMNNVAIHAQDSYDEAVRWRNTAKRLGLPSQLSLLSDMTKEQCILFMQHH